MFLSQSTQNYLAQNRGRISARWLLWVSAVNRSTGDTETTGLWTGADDETFLVEGEERDYFGAGGLLDIAPLTYEAGTDIQSQTVSIAAVTAEAAQLLRVYDPRLAPAELHLALFDPDSEGLIGIERAFKGWVDTAPISEGALRDGTSATICELNLVSSSRQGTRTLTLKKSDSAQKERGGDRGRRYADVSGTVATWWGSEREEADE